MDPSAAPAARTATGPLEHPGLRLADLAIGATVTAAQLAGRPLSALARAGSTVVERAQPLGRRVLRPRFVDQRLWPQSVAQRLADRGRRQRVETQVLVVRRLRALLPVVVATALRELDRAQVDLTPLAGRLDLDEVARRLDLDAAVSRVDIGAVLDRVDIASVLDRVDVDAVVARADLDAAAARLDLDAAVARVDIGAVLDRVDVDEVAAKVDLDAIVDRIDLVGLAEYVIDAVDLPGIIRESTGTMASEGVRGVRMQSIDADQRLNRLVDRALLRRHGRHTEVLAGPDGGEAR